MKIAVSKQIGKSKITFEAEKEKQVETLAEAAFYASTPDKCTLCNSTDVELFSNKAEGYTFVKIRCLNPDCRATAQCGQYKDGSGCFWKKFEKYIPSATQVPVVPTSVGTPAPAVAKTEEDDEIPF